MNDRDALRYAARLEQLGVIIRSVELRETAKAHTEFNANGGNRAMRRATARSGRKRGKKPV